MRDDRSAGLREAAMLVDAAWSMGARRRYAAMDTAIVALREALAADKPDEGLPAAAGLDADTLSQALADANIWELAAQKRTTDEIAPLVAECYREAARLAREETEG